MKHKTLLLLSLVRGRPTEVCCWRPSQPPRPVNPRSPGQVPLVNFGGCNDCHTPHKLGPNGPEPDLTHFLAGHPENAKLPTPPSLPAGPWVAVTTGDTAWSGPWGISYAANLTPDQVTGLGIWKEDMFLKAMRTGKHMSVGRPILPPMPWQSLAQLSDKDLKAIYSYLRTIPSVKNHVPSAVPPGGQPALEKSARSLLAGESCLPNRGSCA